MVVAARPPRPVRRSLRPSAVALVAIAGLAACSSSALAGPGVTFIPFGQSIGQNYGSALSNDGTQVVGGDAVTGATAWHWSGGVFTTVPGLPGGAGDALVNDVSNNGVVAGYSNGANGGEAFMWTAGGGTVGLGNFSPSMFFYSEATGVSDDGSIIVGTGTDMVSNRSFRHDGALNSLGSFPGTAFDRNHALGVSGDGSRIVGYGFNAANNFEAYTWTSGSGIVGVGNIGWDNTVAEAISANGAVIAGNAWNDVAGGSDEGFVIVGATTFTIASALGDVYVNDVSNAGVTVGVIDTGPGSSSAFVFAPGVGLFTLDTLMAGIPAAAGWTFLSASGISADSSTLLVTGLNPSGEVETALIVIPGAPAASLAALVGVMAARRRRRVV